MDYNDALDTSIDSGFSYVFHKYRILPSIITATALLNGTRTEVYPFQIPYLEDEEMSKRHILDMERIGDEISLLSIEGYMESNGDLDDKRIATFRVPIPNAGVVMNPKFYPCYNFIGIAGFEQRTRDAARLVRKISKSAKYFMTSLTRIDQDLSVNNLIAEALGRCVNDGYCISDTDCKRRILYGMNDAEYLFVLSMINQVLYEKVYEPFHLTDPDAVHYLCQDFNGFCKEYKMDGKKREVVDLYRKCFQNRYIDLYTHVMHWGNIKYMRSLKHDAISRFSDDVTKVIQSNNEELCSFGFTGDGYETSQAIGTPCSMGATNLFIMKMKKGSQDE